MTVFNKLVRDNIPQIIAAQGEKPNFKILSDERYLSELDRKLNEEIQEYQESKSLEELADILEVVYAICKARGHSTQELHCIRDEKLQSRGAFEKRYFLVSKE